MSRNRKHGPGMHPRDAITAAPLRTTIDDDAQRYVDEPVYRMVSKADPIALLVNRAYARTKQRGPEIKAEIEELSHHERVLLRWMTPDGKGGLKPKYERDQ